MIWTSEYRSGDASLSGGLYRPMRLDGSEEHEPLCNLEIVIFATQMGFNLK